MDASIFRADGRTVLVGSDAMLRKVWGNHAKPKAGAMSKLLGDIKDRPDLTAVTLVEPLRPLIAIPLGMAPLPPALDDAKQLPNLVTSVSEKINILGGLSGSVTIRTNATTRPPSRSRKSSTS